MTYLRGEPPGTIVIDREPHLYLVQEGGRAIRYGVGVGRQGFGWSGVATIHDKQEWPDWYPPKEMIARQPELRRPDRRAAKRPRRPGGPRNPLGARAMYLWQGNKDTLYRIHGTLEPWTIGTNVSSGCIRMINQDVIDLYARTPIGARAWSCSADPRALAGRSDLPAVIGPVQQRLALARAAEEVAGLAVPLDLAGHGGGSPSSGRSGARPRRHPAAHVVAAIPLEPAARIVRVDPALGAPTDERLAGIDAEEVERRVAPLRRELRAARTSSPGNSSRQSVMYLPPNTPSRSISRRRQLAAGSPGSKSRPAGAVSA